jgi:hypothetical protein
MVIVEYLTRLGKQRLHVFPYPRGPIAHHTKPHAIFGNQPGVFDFWQGIAKIALVLHLMPTEQVDHAPLINEIKAKAFGIAPRPLPLRPLGPKAPLTRTTPSGAFGARGHKRPINVNSQ